MEAPADGAEVFRLEVMDAAPKGSSSCAGHRTARRLRRSPAAAARRTAGGAANSEDILSIKPELVLRLGGNEALHGVAKTTPHAAADLRFDAHGSSTLQITWEGRRLNSPSPASSDPFVPFRAVVTALAPLMRPATAKCARQLLLTSLGASLSSHLVVAMRDPAAAAGVVVEILRQLIGADAPEPSWASLRQLQRLIGSQGGAGRATATLLYADVVLPLLGRCARVLLAEGGADARGWRRGELGAGPRHRRPSV